MTNRSFKTFSNTCRFGLISAAFAWAAGAVSAAITPFSSRTALEAELENFYYQSFSSYSSNTSLPAQSFSGSGFSYTITAKDPAIPDQNHSLSSTQLFHHNGRIVSIGTIRDLIVTFTSPTNSAGANFYFVNAAAATQFTPIQVTYTLSDSSTYVFNGAGGSFVGLTVDDGRLITKMVLSRANSVDGVIDNLVVGNTQIIPEPSTAVLLVGMVALGFSAQRRRRL